MLEVYFILFIFHKMSTFSVKFSSTPDCFTLTDIAVAQKKSIKCLFY